MWTPFDARFGTHLKRLKQYKLILQMEIEAATDAELIEKYGIIEKQLQETQDSLEQHRETYTVIENEFASKS